MKNIFIPILLLFCGMSFFTSCEDDRDSNPVLTKPTHFVLNTPGISANNVLDLANSGTVVLTCSQPDYGFPASTAYTVEVATKADMSDAVALEETFTTARITVIAEEMASALTTLQLKNGKSEADFPMTMPVYVRVKAVMTNKMGKGVNNTDILSNVVTFNKVRLHFALPPVDCPKELYIAGSFSGWKWDSAVKMVEVHSSRDEANTKAVFWHLVYIDEQGIKFNTTTAWDGNDVGFANITVNPESELGADIKDAEGNIASSKPGWYLMIVKATLNGRDIIYDVLFNKPNVWLMGPVVGNTSWNELEPGWSFNVPASADGDFVSPAFAGDVPGGDGDGVRIYVKIPGYDWWKAEMIVGIDKNNLSYRGTGGDQPRVAGTKGQKVYLNFTKETGEIK